MEIFAAACCQKNDLWGQDENTKIMHDVVGGCAVGLASFRAIERVSNTHEVVEADISSTMLTEICERYRCVIQKN
jgi:hypothetical protein